MPELSQSIAKRLNELLETLPQCLVRSDGSFEDIPGVSRGHGWCVSAASIIAAVVTEPSHPYRTMAAASLGLMQKQIVDACAALHGQLQQLKYDFEAGLLSNLESRVSGETFDDLLDHAEAYLKDGRREPAGVLAGVVFEDTIRTLSRKHDIDPAGRELDNLLAALKAKGVLTKLEQKEGVTAAEVRAKATHAEWSAFNAEQAEATIKFTRRLIREKLVT